jgi:hypothetical protein
MESEITSYAQPQRLTGRELSVLAKSDREGKNQNQDDNCN